MSFLIFPTSHNTERVDMSKVSPVTAMSPTATPKHDDVVHTFASLNTLTWTAEEEKKLVRKIDLFLMPTIWLMYLLSYMVSRYFLIRDVTNALY